MKNEEIDSVLGDTVTPRPSGSDEKHADPEPPANDFHPIKIDGEPLSAIIIRERR